jgi:uncharacterized delta-60 repeat protein
MDHMARIFSAVLVLLHAVAGSAQAGNVDLSFAPMDITGGSDHGLDGSCRAIGVQPDGKVLVAGDFTHCNGLERGRIARMNADGTLDLSFDPGYGANGSVRTLAVQPDGSIIIGGSFTYVNGVPCNRIARLTANGAVDEGFDPGNGFNHDVFALALQPDGRILVGGDFGSCNGEDGNRIARLYADGSRDHSFELEDGVLDAVRVIVPLANGTVIIGGSFSSIDDQPRNGIARLLTDGGLDVEFAPEGWYGGSVNTVIPLANGQLIVGGNLPGSLARLNADGSTDAEFLSSGIGFTGWDPWVFAVQPDAQGRLLVAGRFTHFNGTAVNGIARLTENGDLDPTFQSGEGFNSDVFAMAVQPDGKVLTGGFFDSVNGTARNRVARLLAEDLSTALWETNDVQLAVFPNPSSGPVVISSTMGGSASLVITDLNGRMVEEQQNLPAGVVQRHLDLGQEPKGVYVVRITAGNEVHTRRVVIQ